MAWLGIDLGTSAVKALIVEHDGRILAVGKVAYPVLTPHPGWSEAHPKEWWDATVAAVCAALAQAPQIPIAAIGLAGQMHGVVLIDGDGRPTRPAVFWPDARAEPALAAYRALPADLRDRLANPLVPGMAGPILLWLAQYDVAAYQAARWAIQPKDWLRLRLTGMIASDPSDASGTLLYDLAADGWSGEVIAALGLRRELFPSLLPASAVAGPLIPDAAASLGLPVGVPVAIGAADTAAGLLGSGLLEPGVVQLTLGTGAQIATLVATPAPDPAWRTHRYRTATTRSGADGAPWYALAAVQNAGLALDWVRHLLGASWDELYLSADQAHPDLTDPLLVPYLARERAHHQGPDLGGSFHGLRLAQQREQLLRAALVGVAFGIRQALEALPAADSITTLHLAGGGSRYAGWRQLLADCLGRSLLPVEASDAATRGAALLAGLAIGAWPDPHDLPTPQTDPSSIAAPDPERAARYEQIYARYLHLAE